MKLLLKAYKAVGYKSQSQKIRVITELWVEEEIFCPSCGRDVERHINNRPVADFFCKECCSDYELKSKKDGFGKKIVDGAFDTMIERVNSNNSPNLFLLNYDSKKFEVSNFFVVPRYYFVPTLIEQRKPLSPTAKRAGWVGCNILLAGIPQTGKIYFVKNGVVEPKDKILSEWAKTTFLLKEETISNKGWLLDIMKCIEETGKKQFALDDIYAFEGELRKKYPDNRHIKDKIRQQLQMLRDKGYLKFLGRGRYGVD